MNYRHVALICLFLFGQVHEVFGEPNIFSGSGGEEVVRALVATGVFVCGVVLGIKQWCVGSEKDKRRAQEVKTNEECEQEAELNRQRMERVEAECRFAQQQAASRKKAQELKQQQEDQAIYKERITRVMQHDDTDVYDYYELYQEIEIQELRGNEASPLQYIIKRSQALHDHFYGKDLWQEETYQLSIKSQALLHECGIASGDYLVCFGNQIQRTMHQEFVNILNDAAQCNLKDAQLIKERKAIASTVTQFAHAGQLHNRAGYVGQGFVFADFCHGLMDLGKKVLAVNCDIATVCGRGFIKGGNNFADKITHPIETLQKTALGLAQLVNTIGKAVESNVIRFVASNVQDIKDLHNGKVTQWDIIKRDVHVSYKTIKEVHDVLTITWQHLDYQKMLLGIEEASALVTETMLTSATLGALGALTKNGSIGLHDFLSDGTRAFTDLPCNGNTIQAAISYEAIMADVMGASARAVKGVGVAIAETLDGAAKLAPGLVLMQNGSGDGLINPVGGGGNIPNPPTDIFLEMQPIRDVELNNLIKNFDGIRLHNGNHLTFRYRHAWEVESIKKGTSIGGFHQDYMGYYRKLGLIRNIKTYSNGFYKGEVCIGNGIWIEKTFFPENWTKNQIMQCVIDIFDTQRIISAKGGRTIIQNIFEKDVEILIVIDDLTGVCRSFYPILNGNSI